MPIITPGSDYERRMNERTRVNNLTNFSTPTSEKKFCNICSVGLRLKEIDGITKWWCSSWNNTTIIDAGTSIENANSRYESRYGSTSKQNFFIISQTKKKKTAEEEEKERIRKELGGRDGLTVNDSREYTYDSQGGWT